MRLGVSGKGEFPEMRAGRPASDQKKSCLLRVECGKGQGVCDSEKFLFV